MEQCLQPPVKRVSDTLYRSNSFNTLWTTCVANIERKWFPAFIEMKAMAPNKIILDIFTAVQILFTFSIMAFNVLCECK